jgi:hypothetical protein
VHRTQLPPVVQEPVTRYLKLADRYLPRKIVAFYIVGSLALGDYHDQLSDIDFVAVAEKPFSDEALEKAKNLHRELAAEFPKPDFDGVYVLLEQLQNAPNGTGIASYQGGTLHNGRAFNVNPITWHLLNTCPIPIHGNPEPDVYDDIAERQEWCKENIEEYWKPWTQGAKQKLRTIQVLNDADVTWGVLGITRLHATIVTGNVISKTEASKYAKQTFSQKWQGIINQIAAERNHYDMGTTSGPSVKTSFSIV